MAMLEGTWRVVAIAASGIIFGAAIGGVAGVLADREGTAEVAATAIDGLVPVQACPNAGDALGYVPRGGRVLVTSVGEDPEYVEINFQTSPNGFGWVPTDEIEPDTTLDDLPRGSCRRILPEDGSASATPTPDVTASPQPTSPAALTPTPAAPRTPTPTPAPISTGTPSPVDTEPPVVSAVSMKPVEVNEVPSDACVDGPTTTEVTAEVSDPSGLSEVSALYNPPGSSEPTTVPMILSGGVYMAAVGPFSTVGSADASIEMTVRARDQAGNVTSRSAGSLLVHDCTFL